MSALNKVPTGHPLTTMAREIVAVILPDGVEPVYRTDAKVLELVALPNKTDAENMQVVHNVTNTVFMGIRDEKPLAKIEERVLLELLWCGYWSPEL